VAVWKRLPPGAMEMKGSAQIRARHINEEILEISGKK